jgi:hypothetical protein
VRIKSDGDFDCREPNDFTNLLHPPFESTDCKRTFVVMLRSTGYGRVVPVDHRQKPTRKSRTDKMRDGLLSRQYETTADQTTLCSWSAKPAIAKRIQPAPSERIDEGTAELGARPPAALVGCFDSGGKNSFLQFHEA